MSLEPWPVPSAWRGPIDLYLDAQRAGGKPATTIYTRRQHLEQLARGIGGDPRHTTGEELLAWAAAQTWAPETRRGRRATFRSFWSWMVEAGYAERSAADALPVVRPAAPRVRAIPAEPLARAVQRADERTALILRLGAELGLRRAEIARVHADDLEPDLLGWSLVVHGKGGRRRVLPVPDALAAELRRHLAGGGWLFPGRDGGHLSPRWVGKLATRELPASWTTHALRHRFAGVAHAACGDLLVVQDLLGHASPTTTRVYLPPNPSRARDVICALPRAA